MSETPKQTAKKHPLFKLGMNLALKLTDHYTNNRISALKEAVSLAGELCDGIEELVDAQPEFKFQLEQEVTNIRHNVEGFVKMQSVDKTGILYFVETKTRSNWVEEAELVATVRP